MSSFDFKTINPYTEETIKHYTYASDRQINQALGRLNSVKKSFKERLQNLKTLAQALEEKKEVLSLQITREMGKPLFEARAEVAKSISAISYVIEEGPSFFSNISLKKIFGGSNNSSVVYNIEPLGTLLAIEPWNFPVWQLFRVLPWNYLLGNSVIHKPSDLTAGVGELLNSLIEECLGSDSFCGLFLSNGQISSLIGSSSVQVVTLTGSPRAGREVAQRSGFNLKKVILELGGSDPFIVTESADLDKSVQAAVASRLVNGGQSCIAAKRFIIHKSLYKQFKKSLELALNKKIYGNPFSEGAELGPLAHKRFHSLLDEKIKKLKQQGGQSVDFFKNPSVTYPFYPPQIWEVNGKEEICLNEEFFGPIFLISSYESNQEALNVANSSCFALGASVWGEESKDLNYFAKNLNAGMVFINDWVKSDPALPFGGSKYSGFGREMSYWGFLEMASIKVIQSQKGFSLNSFSEVD